LATLKASADVHEVILSGGDPLLLDDDALARLLERLESIGQLRRLRLHTRLPVVLPGRVTSALCRLLSRGRLRPVIVIHVNHPTELGGAAAAALDRLDRARIPLLNQSVLLRGVNDDADVLATLAERLFDLRVTNYYLHQLDRVNGAAHFEVDDARALRLQQQLRQRLPGYLVPRLVREQAGATHKTPLG
jgi:KamA family protein